MTRPVTIIDLPSGHPEWPAALQVLTELRPHLTPHDLQTVLTDGEAQGLRFIGAFQDNDCLGVAGYRLIVNTSAGRKLYVDDLVVTANTRSKGVGAQLLTELINRARDLNANQIDLDSGVQRFDAHRFYLNHRFHIRSHHFTREL